MITTADLFALAFGVDLRALPEPTPDQVKLAEEMRAWLSSRPHWSER